MADTFDTVEISSGGGGPKLPGVVYTSTANSTEFMPFGGIAFRDAANSSRFFQVSTATPLPVQLSSNFPVTLASSPSVYIVNSSAVSVRVDNSSAISVSVASTPTVVIVNSSPVPVSCASTIPVTWTSTLPVTLGGATVAVTVGNTASVTIANTSTAKIPVQPFAGMDASTYATATLTTTTFADLLAASTDLIIHLTDLALCNNGSIGQRVAITSGASSAASTVWIVPAPATADTISGAVQSFTRPLRCGTGALKAKLTTASTAGVDISVNAYRGP